MNIAFIDHSYHKTTKSSNFFIELLEKNNEVVVYYCDFWISGETIDLNEIKNKYDCYIFWQLLYPTEKIDELGEAANIVLIPMYDGVFNKPDDFWVEYYKYKFFSFSKILHDKFKFLGIDTEYFQYFPAPIAKSQLKKASSQAISCFYWQRNHRLTWKTIRKLIHGLNIDKFIFHKAGDPNHKHIILPSRHEIKKYNIKFTEWVDSQADYQNLFNNCDIYFSPRIHEGIGMSFLEAMAMGKVVVAPNRPTMNEYIEHGNNGILYDINNPKAINISNLYSLKENAYNTIVNGYKVWNDQEENILNFLNRKVKFDLKKILNNYAQVTKILNDTIEKNNKKSWFGIIKRKK